MTILNAGQRELCSRHIRLAGWAVRKFVPVSFRHLLSTEEWEAEAYYCLVKAAALYSSQRSRFTTYATCALKRHLHRVLEKLTHGQTKFESVMRSLDYSMYDDATTVGSLMSSESPSNHELSANVELLEPFLTDGRLDWRKIAEVIGARNAAVLRERIEHDKTLSELARRYQVSRQRIRQIIVDSEKRLASYLKFLDLRKIHRTKAHVSMISGKKISTRPLR